MIEVSILVVIVAVAVGSAWSSIDIGKEDRDLERSRRRMRQFPVINTDWESPLKPKSEWNGRVLVRYPATNTKVVK